MAHREPDAVLHSYIALNKPEAWVKDLDFSTPAVAMETVAEEFDGWAPGLRSLILDGDTAPVARSLHTLPVDHRWDHVPLVTLIGDAAHLMIPSGEGANLALFDGAELAKAIAKHRHDMDTGIQEHEEKMFLRSAAAAMEAKALIEVLLGENSPQSLVSMFGSEHHSDQDGSAII
jgi:2-polyprenyl-6-methoxyphenol hydroxylase-like FAD-dependent oxidoreductase